MQKPVVGCFMLLAVSLSPGCVAQPSVPLLPPVRLNDVVVLRQQGLADETLIQQIEQRGLAFALTPDDADTLRKAGVSEGVVRYLQGRAAGERDMARLQARNRFDRRYYYGDPFFLGPNGVHGLYASHHHHHGHR